MTPNSVPRFRCANPTHHALPRRTATPPAPLLWRLRWSCCRSTICRRGRPPGPMPVSQARTCPSRIRPPPSPSAVAGRLQPFAGLRVGRGEALVQLFAFFAEPVPPGRVEMGETTGTLVAEVAGRAMPQLVQPTSLISTSAAITPAFTSSPSSSSIQRASRVRAIQESPRFLFVVVDLPDDRFVDQLRGSDPASSRMLTRAERRQIGSILLPKLP